MINVWFRLRFIAVLSLTLVSTVSVAGVSLRLESCRFGDKEFPSYILENDFVAFTIVPARGGRIIEWIDKKAGNVNVVDLPRDTDRPTYGGLLDDHGWVSMVVDRSHFWELPFECKVVSKSDEGLVVDLWPEEFSHYKRRLTLRSGSPLLKIEYRFDNISHEDGGNTLIRNVVWPSGAASPEDHIYSTPLGAGLLISNDPVNTAEGRKRETVAAPWRAVGSLSQKRLVAFAFADDYFMGAYDWEGSKTRPSFEWYYDAIPAGKSVETAMWCYIAHGFSKAVHVSERLVADLDVERRGDRIEIGWALAAMEPTLKDAVLETFIADPDGNEIQRLEDVVLRNLEIDQRREGIVAWEAGAPRPIVIVQRLVSDGDVVARYEYPYEIDKAGYARKIERPRKAAMTQLEGWKPLPPLEVKPTAADMERGYVVYSGEGDERGQSIDSITVDICSGGEYESIELRMKALADIGTNVSFSVSSENAPLSALDVTGAEKIFIARVWSKDLYGWRLSGETNTAAGGEEDFSFWLIANSADLKPGSYSLEVAIKPQNGKESRLPVKLNVLDVRIPEDRHYFLEANTSFNHLGQNYRIGPFTRDWNFNLENIAVYADDFHAHGGRMVTAYGYGTAPGNSYPNIKLRDSGLGLLDALDADPDILKRENLPALDLSFWNDWMQIWLERGYTRYTSGYLSGGVSGYWNRHAQLAKRYGADTNKVRRWIQSETARYLKERGFRYVYGHIGDEIAPDVFEEWMPAAIDATECGWSPGVTISSSFFRTPEIYAKAGPLMRYWVINGPDAGLMRKAREDGTIKPGDSVGSYTGTGGRYRTYADMRAQMWQRVMTSMDVFWIQCYIRKHSESIVFNEDNIPYSSAAWEGLRDGTEDANYIKAVIGMTEVLGRENPQEAARFRERLEAIAATVDNNDASTTRTAKMRLIELLRDLREITPRVKASLMWEEVPIVEEGQPRFALAATADGLAAAESLANTIAKKTGANINVADAGSLAKIEGDMILFGHPDDVPLLRRFPREELGVSDHYPADGSYMVVERNIDGQRVFMVLGRGKGLALGAANLGRILKYNPEYSDQYFWD